MILELGPVLTALILAGRIGARYPPSSAPCGHRADRLRSRAWARRTCQHLLIPRVIAGLLVIPALTMFANAMGICGGLSHRQGLLGLTYGDFEYGARYFFRRSTSGTRPSRACARGGAHDHPLSTWAFNTQAGRRGGGARHQDRGGCRVGGDPDASTPDTKLLLVANDRG